MSTATATRRWFGTDGIRGPFGTPPLDETTVRALGLALGARFAAREESASRPIAVLGGDTRASTPTLCQWLADGLVAHGIDIHFVGTLPTPGVAYLARHFGAACGIAVSASHNPYQDNGIKLIGGDGFKWKTVHEAEIESAMARILDQDPATADRAAHGASLEPACLDIDHEAIRVYLDSLHASVGGADASPLAGLDVVLDAANGAASALAEPLFRALGARVTLMHASPDGHNINRGCGSTHPEVLAARVVADGADLGIAFDGDADRAIFVDEEGTVRDGDAALYLWARHLADAGRLPGAAIVATTMSNLGLEAGLRDHGIALIRADVGDRAVVETLLSRDLMLGGEQSGHLVDLDLATTGDGMLTGLQIAAILAQGDAGFSTRLNGFARYPQLIENVRVARKPDLDSLPAVVAAQREVESTLGNDGRLVLRYSGTEPLARIMIEGRDRATIERLASQLARVIDAAIGA